jgi:hypothetical protein
MVDCGGGNISLNKTFIIGVKPVTPILPCSAYTTDLIFNCNGNKVFTFSGDTITPYFDLRLRNRITQYDGESGVNLVGKFLSGTTDGFVLADISEIADSTDSFVTGGTYNSGTEEIEFVGTNSATTFKVDVSALLDDTNTFTTGATLSGSTLIFDRNDEANAYDVDLSSLEFSGDYNDLTNTPTNLSDFNNDENFISCDDLSDCPVIQQGFQLITSTQQDIIDLQNELPNYLPLSGGTMTGEIVTTIERWTFDFMDKLDITIYADDNFSIDEITNIVDTPTITIEVNDVLYTLGNVIALGDKIKITSDIASVVKLKIVK